MSAPTYKLKYFDARGVIENVRIMFAIAKQEYEDFRYPVDFTTWAKPEFDADKAAGTLAVNMDRAPVLFYNGTAIGQSKTIERFVANKCGFAGSSDVEGALIDMLCEHIADIKKNYSDCKVGLKDEALNEAKTKWVTEKMPEWMGKLEKCLSGTGGYAVGNKMSLADIVIYSFVSEFLDDKDLAIASVANCPKLKASVAAVTEAGKEWFAIRPDTKM